MCETAPAIADLQSFFLTNESLIPRSVHMDWCICSLKEFKVLDSAHTIINPGVNIDSVTQGQTKIT